MANIIGEPLRKYVIDQINARQALHGSGVFKTTSDSSSDINSLFNNYLRSDDQINTLNSNTAWIKLASGVSLIGENGRSRLKDIGFLDDELESFMGDKLAKNFILYGGTSVWNTNNFGNEVTTQKQGFLEDYNPNSSYIYSYLRALDAQGDQAKGADFGYNPMPGIISAEIKSLNRGSLEKAFIKIKANDRRQLDILDILYMRLGYTVLLEWGNSLYTTDGKDRKSVTNTLIEKNFFQVGEASTYFDFMGVGGISLIEQYRNKYDGNYDGMLAVVSNFDWTFNPDGSYDINLTLISMGDVIESLKSNISLDASFANYVKNSPTSTTQPSDSLIEKNKDTNIITSTLWLYKKLGYDTQKPVELRIPSNPPKLYGVGKLLNNTTSTIAFTQTSYEFYEDWSPTNSLPVKIGNNTFNSPDTDTDATNYLQTLPEVINAKNSTGGTIEVSGNTVYVNNSEGVPEYSYSWKKGLSNNTSTISNPLSTAKSGDGAVIFTSTNDQYYLRFGYLLQFLQEKVIPVIKGEKHSPPLTKIDYDTSSNTMYFIPNQISLDPRVCIVRNDSFLKANGEYASAFIGLNPFTELDKSSNPGTNGSFTRGTTGNSNVSYIMNIYLNFEYIISSLESNTNERGDVNVYGFISSICSGLNKALGGVNNLEPVIDKSDNVLKIIDSTPIPGVSYPNPTTPYDLNLFGYYRNDKSKWETSQIAEYTSTFVRKIDLKTAITPEYATMVTIGATANGYVKGTEATAFSRWNLGIKDRFKNQINSPNPPSTTATSGLDEAEYNYAITFLGQVFQCYGFDPITVDANGFGNGYFGDLNPEIIEKNLSIATEFYKYIIAKKGQTSQQAGTIGFIPFKLGITMDGISGIKIYNKLEVNSKFLPTKYGDTLNFIITGVNHKLQNNDWETNLETIVMPKTTKIDSLGLNITKIKQIVQTAQDTTSTPTGPVGDLYTWAKGDFSAVPDFPDGYIANVLSYSKVTPAPTWYSPTNPPTLIRKNADGTYEYKKSERTAKQDEDYIFAPILKTLGAPVTQGNLLFLIAWRKSDYNVFLNNPLSTTLQKGIEESKRSKANSKDVQHYFDAATGVKATVATLNAVRSNGTVLYPNIVKAFRKGIPDRENARKLANLLQRKFTFDQVAVDNLINSW
jgi:hypothetical protein